MRRNEGGLIRLYLADKNVCRSRLRYEDGTVDREMSSLQARLGILVLERLFLHTLLRFDISRA